ncbi:MAG: glucosaminidase domain-containing protein [Pseudomonadota bacterium]|nr:glucosaminidase domain-containing protein [Pseudomonadota bacterium]
MSSSKNEKPFWIQIWAQDDTRKIKLTVASIAAIAMVGLIVTFQNLADDQIQTQVEVAELAPITVFPNFASIQNLSLKKRQFFDYLEDYVLAENESIIRARNELKRYVAIADSGVEFSERERYWLLNLADDYRIESEKHSEREILNELMLRIDVLPASLALAQAANESAWGTSRFALQGNNVFGQWCYEAGCGIIPAQRKTGASHEVRSFETIASSVQAYFLNINTHASYSYLRDLRSRMRARNLPFDPMSLAIGLGRYSERGDNYVNEVQRIILQNDLRKRDREIDI